MTSLILTLSAASPLESPSSLVSMPPVIPISILKVVTSALYQKRNIYVDVAILLKERVTKVIRVYRTRRTKILLYRSTIRKKHVKTLPIVNSE
jgi:hypothetical protein